MQKSVLILILSALLLLTSILVAEVAQTINYQGQLTDTGGDPVANGVYSMTFNLYNDPASGAPIWSSLVRQVVVTDGLFSYTLGDSVALAYDLFSSDYGLWLGVKVGADPEMTPLTRLTAAPMAAVAASLNGDMKTSLGKLVLDDGRTGGGLDSTVVIASEASTLDHHGHVTILKIANGGADTTDLVGLFGDPDFARVEVGDGNAPDSGVVVQSAVDHKHHGHVKIFKIANGGADTTDLVGLFGDPDFAGVEVGDGNDPDSGV
ncbi:MAG: hypothetical protein GY839_10890, partial [candidate division Zixibacteria bacterium]|nr:hypothetical protein [candidate division Zixibacteria bacterium]